MYSNNARNTFFKKLYNYTREFKNYIIIITLKKFKIYKAAKNKHEENKLYKKTFVYTKIFGYKHY
jgi:hypothetical protein